MTDRQFLEQYREIIVDLADSRVPDSFELFDPEVAYTIRECIRQAMIDNADDPVGVIHTIEAIVLTHFVVGRMHAERGYPFPSEQVFAPPVIPDSPDSINWDAAD